MDALSGIFQSRTDEIDPPQDYSETETPSTIPLNRGSREMYESLATNLMSGNISVSNVQVLGLNAFREKVGNQWQIHSNVIKTIIESALGKALTARDRYWRLDDEVYIIAFADTDVAKTMRRTEAIGEAIVRHLVGTDTGTHVSVKALAGSLSRSIDGKIQFTQSQASPANGTAAANRPNSSDAHGAMQGQPKVTFASKAKTMRNKEAGEALDALLQKSAEVHKQRTGEALAEKIAREHDASEALRMAEAAELELQPSNYSIGFAPIWDVNKKAITAYGVLPHCKMGTRSYVEHDVLGSIPSPEDVLDLDIACLTIAIQETAKSYTDGRAVLILTQMHYATLSSKTGLAEVLRESVRVPDFLHKYIAVQIVGIPADASVALLTKAIGQLHHHFRLVVGRTTVKSSPLRMKEFGFDIISLVHDAPEVSAEDVTAYQKFLTGARALALPVVAEYISTTVLAKQLAALGMVSLAGKAIGAPMLTPEGVLPCNIETMPVRAVDSPAS